MTMVMETNKDSEEHSARNQAETFPNKLDDRVYTSEVSSSLHNSLKTSNSNMSFTSSASGDIAPVSSYQTTDTTSSGTNSYTVGSQYQPATMSAPYHDSHRFSGPPTSSAPQNMNQPPAATPTLNQLLTQSPQGAQKYPPYSDYSSSATSSAGGAGAPNQQMYDMWNNQNRNAAPTHNMYTGPNQINHPMRGGPGGPMPANIRQMPPNSMQHMSGNMYDRPGQAMPPGYRNPSPQFGGPPQVPPGGIYRRMPAPPHQPYPGSSQDGGQSSADMNDMMSQRGGGHQPMSASGGMMGPPPRLPPSHIDGGSNSQMMPPPNQNQSYPGVPYGYRPPYSNYPPSSQPAANQIPRMPHQGSYPQGSQPPGQPHPPSPQMNGPMSQLKTMPPSPSQPMGQPSPGAPAGHMRGMSPAPNQHLSSAPPSVQSQQGKGLSPCPSPSVNAHSRSMPASPAMISSPHNIAVSSSLSTGHNDPQSAQSSPRVDTQTLSPAANTSSPTKISPNSTQSSQRKAPSDVPDNMMHSEQQQQQTDQSKQQVPIPSSSGPIPPHQQQQGNMMGNGIPPYPYPQMAQNQQQMPPNPMYQQSGSMQRPPVPGGQFQPPGAPGQYPPSSQYPNQMQAGYPQPAPHQLPGHWNPQQQDNHHPGMKGSPMVNAAQSPAVQSPAGTEMRPPSRKSSVAPSPGPDAGSRGNTPQKPVGPPPPGTVHGSSMDVVNKQLEFGPEPVRKPFMDHLCMFYYEKSQPLTAMPTIGKNSLDLWKMFMAVKEKGGFQQVCKKKQWKQVGTVLASTTSQNAAFSLKKAYVKYLLPYECKFERGGIDPQTVLNAVDTKKEKQSRNAPSPGSSSNSQEAHSNMKGPGGGYPDYMPGMGNQYPHGPPPHHMPPGSGGPMRPGVPGHYPHDPNMPPQPHWGGYNNMSGGMPNGHQPPPGMNSQMPPQQGMMGPDDQMSDPYRQQQQQQMPGHYNQQPNQHMGPGGFPPRHPYYGPNGPRMPPPGQQRPPFHHPQGNSGPMPPQHPNSQQAQMRMMGPGSQPQQQTVPHSHSNTGYPPNMYNRENSFPSSQSGPHQPPPSSSSYPMDNQSMSASGHLPGMRPLPPAPQHHQHQSSPHPQQMPQHLQQHSQPPPMYSQSSADSNSSAIMSSSGPSTPSRARSSTFTKSLPPGSSRGALSAMLSSSASSGLDHVIQHPNMPSVGSFSESLNWSYLNINNCGNGSFIDSLEMPPPPLPLLTCGNNSGGHVEQHSVTNATRAMRSANQMRPQPGLEMTPVRPAPPGTRSNSFSKREVTFPANSVEATQPRQVKRKVLSARDIGRANGVISYGKVDCRKIIMCLKSSLLCECVWALDTLTVLLHDDNMVLNFNLDKMPGLLDIILAHYKRSLSMLFEELSDLASTDSSSTEDNNTSAQDDAEDMNLYSKHVMSTCSNYSWVSRNGMKVAVDSDLKRFKTMPSPSMYSKKPYQVEEIDSVVISFYESENTNDYYRSQFSSHVSNDNKRSSICARNHGDDSTKDDGDSGCVIHSPAPTSHTSAATEFSATSSQSIISEKRTIASDAGLSQLSICSCDIKAEVFAEHQCSGKKLLAGSEAVHVKLEPIAAETSGNPDELDTLRDQIRISRKRRFSDTIDEEPTLRDEALIEALVDQKLEEVAIRCVTLANIIRSFSFIPHNEKTLAKHSDLLDIFGRILNLKLKVDSANEQRAWWWDTVDSLREHTLVSLSNVAGYLKVIYLVNQVAFPLMDSLLFWATTPAAYARDPLPAAPNLSIQTLVMEILCKMCAHSDNISMLLATPPWSRINSLFSILSKYLTEHDQTLREFALVIISCLAQADPIAATGLARQPSLISLLIGVLESAEAQAFSIAQQRGVEALRDKPEAMGTTLDMIRRTSGALVDMAKVEDNHSILIQQQDRLLNLVMSQILDQYVAKMLSEVLYECTKNSQYDIPVSYVQVEKSDSDAENLSTAPESSGSVRPENQVKQEAVEDKATLSSENGNSKDSSEECNNKENIDNSPSVPSSVNPSSASTASSSSLTNTSMEILSAAS